MKLKGTARALVLSLGVVGLMATSWGFYERRITVQSDNHRLSRARIDLDGMRVRLVHRRSDAPCIEGVSWGYDRRGIWVDRGCRADFVVAPIRNHDRDYDRDHRRDREHDWRDRD